MRKRILLASAVGLAAACVPTYREAAETVPSSTLTFEKGYAIGAGLARSSLQEYWIVQDAACGNPQRAAWFTWANGPQQSRRVAADRQVSILARTKFYTGEGGTSTGQPGARVNISECRSLVQFAPKLGRNYTVIHKTTPESACAIVVVNAQTRSPPPDLTIRQPAPCAQEAIP